MLNQIYFANDTNWQSLIDAISNAGGGGSPISINSTQWQDLLDEIDKGDTSALTTVLTAISGTLAQVKLALDSVVIDNNQWNALITAISRSIVTADVTQNSTQWTNLINAFSSVGIEQDTTQWNNLLNAFSSVGIEQDTTQWNNLLNAFSSVGIEQDTTQFNALINAIQSQQVTLNLSNINSDNTENHSNFVGTSVTAVLNLIYNQLFNPNVLWNKITSFSQFDVYLLKIGIIKILWIDTAKNQINSGWQTGGVGTLPSGYEALLDPPISVNKTLRNATQMFITVNNAGNLNINPSATITSGYAIRQSFIYI